MKILRNLMLVMMLLVIISGPTLLNDPEVPIPKVVRVQTVALFGNESYIF